MSFALILLHNGHHAQRVRRKLPLRRDSNFAKCAAGARLPEVSRAWRAINREEAMKKLISALWLISTLATGAPWAQPYAPNDAGVTNGHCHLNSPHVAAPTHTLLAIRR